MARIADVRVGIVDVGANTVRLLVATREEGRLVAVREQRVQLGLGEEIERIGPDRRGEARGGRGDRRRACASRSQARLRPRSTCS